MPYAATIVADSFGEQKIRLTTIEVTLPKMVVAEFNTHRTLSRNSASSRAIPVERILAAVQSDPVIPEFGLNGPGMQAREVLGGEVAERALSAWLAARDRAVVNAQAMLAAGVHKQVTNRLLEPWMFTTIVATGDEDAWSWFFKLRCDPAAQPEIRTAAVMMRAVVEASTPREIGDRWHLPYIYDGDEWPLSDHLRERGIDPLIHLDHFLARLSAARCARISYLRQHDPRPVEDELAMTDRLISMGHWSPLEHQARSRRHETQVGNLSGWRQLRHYIGDGYGTV